MAPKLVLQLQGCIFLCVRPSRTVLSSVSLSLRSEWGGWGCMALGGDHRELEMPRCVHAMTPLTTA
jgi:hypothetical protein